LQVDVPNETARVLIGYRVRSCEREQLIAFGAQRREPQSPLDCIAAPNPHGILTMASSERE